MFFLQKLLKQAKSGTLFLQKLLIFTILSALIWTFQHYFTNWIESLESDKTLKFLLQDCNCSRTLNLSQEVEKDDLSISLISTTCGEDSFRRGANQKVVTFSFYGDTNSYNHKEKKYFQGKFFTFLYFQLNDNK